MTAEANCWRLRPSLIDANAFRASKEAAGAAESIGVARGKRYFAPSA